jgi:EAL domain-containing protein (putative c-di-GMP-specific phosphodiesterase class I)
MIVLDALPMTIGRSPDCSVMIGSSSLSRMHASFEWQDGQLLFKDLGSTNGSFVNHQRVELPVILKGGDVLHFSNIEYCLKMEEVDVDDEDDDRTRINVKSLSNHFPINGREFLELLDQGLVTGYRQAIINRNGNVIAYELLGRGCHPDLSPSPYDMFSIAGQLNKEVELSVLLRRKGFAQAAEAGISVPLFFNSDPAECLNPKRLLAELAELSRLYPQLQLVFEIHESAVTDQGLMREIRAGLSKLKIGLAYDDFGAGQARLHELAETPPDILKFDISLVSGVTEPGSPRYRLLTSLNAMVQDMGVKTLAEGVETQAEADACMEIGIDYFQGFFFDRPSAILAAKEA